MNKGLFVTATSTGIGKTVFSALCCCILARAGYKTGYYKPVQSGAVRINQMWSAPDCRFVESCLQEFNGCSTHCTYLLQKAASPHFAARLEHVQISLKKIREDYNRFAFSHDYVIVEGAGGLYVPLDRELTLMADIPAALGIPAVLLAQAGLGTINHTALSFAFARGRGIHITAIILLTHSAHPTDIEAENASVLKKITALERIYLVPAVQDVDVDAGRPGNILQCAAQLADILDIGGWING